MAETNRALLAGCAAVLGWMGLPDAWPHGQDATTHKPPIRDIPYVGSLATSMDHRAAFTFSRRVCAWRADFRLAVRSGGL